MSKVRKTKKCVQQKLQVQKANKDAGEAPHHTLDISSIEKDSFLQGDQYLPQGNPLHSTALEDETSPVLKQNKKSAPVKSKQPGKLIPDVVEAPKTKHNQKKQKASAFSEAASESSQQTSNGGIATGRRAKRRISEDREEAGKKQTSGSASSLLSEKGQRSVYNSSTSNEDEEENYHPSQERPNSKKRKLLQNKTGRKQNTKTTSGRASTKHRNPMDMEVVLDAFQECARQYKESVDSDAVRCSIDTFSCSFQEQLSEIITATKEFKGVKLENNRLNSAINQKRSRLLEANAEKMEQGTKLRNLQKEHDELEQQLKHLQDNSTFLQNLRELHQKYLQHCTAHPHEVETYGQT